LLAQYILVLLLAALLPLRNSRKQCLVMGMQIPYMKAATNTLDSVVVQRPSCKQNLCLDKGYDFSEIEREVIKRRYITHISHRGEGRAIKTRYYYSARRWVVIERTNSWHNRFRKLLVRYEKKSYNYLALVEHACCLIVYGRIILG
jgi:putative transposase